MCFESPSLTLGAGGGWGGVAGASWGPCQTVPSPSPVSAGFGDLSVSTHWHWHIGTPTVFRGKLCKEWPAPWRALSSPGASSCRASRARSGEEGSCSSGKEHTVSCTGSEAGMQTATGPPNRPDSWEAGNTASEERCGRVTCGLACRTHSGQTTGHQETTASQTNTLGSERRCGQRAGCVRAPGAVMMAVSQRG